MRLKTAVTPRSRRARRTCASSRPVSLARRASVKPIILSRRRPSAVSGQAVLADLRLGVDDLADAGEEPGVEGGGGVDVVVGQAVAHGLRDDAQAVGRGLAERLDDGGVVGRAGDGDLVKAGQAGFQAGAAPFAATSWMVRPMAIASPTDFIAVVRFGLGAGEFLEGKAGDLGHDIVDGGLEARRA